MSTTPTAAMEAMLDLPPLDLVVKGEARLTALRLNSLNDWEAGRWGTGHTTIESVISNPLLKMRTDRQARRYAPEKTFSITLERRDERALVGPGRQVWYTDGSRMTSGSGAGVFCANPKVEKSFSLGKYASVFQAEIFAINACLQEVIDRGIKKTRIMILSDSQAALKALGKHRIGSSVVKECLDSLEEVTKANRVQLGWVPGHKGVPGNEQADTLAREGSERQFIGPEPVLGITNTTARREVERWVAQKHREYWIQAKGMRHSKLMLETPNKRLKKSLMNLSRRDLRCATGLITGHCGLRKHLHKLGIFKDNPECRLCGYQEETATHIIFECEALALRRFNLTGILGLSDEDNRREELVKELLKLVKGKELFD